MRARLISAKPIDKTTEVRIRAALGRGTGKAWSSKPQKIHR